LFKHLGSPECLFFSLLFPPLELGGVAPGGAGGEFEVEEGIEKTAVAHDAQGVLRCHFHKARLPGHNLGNVVGDGFRDADAVELADMAMGSLDERIGVRQPFILHNLRGDPFMVFAEDEGKEQGGIDVKPCGTPAVDLREAFFKPVGFAFAVGRVEPGSEFREEVFEDIELTTESKDLFGFPATEEFLDFLVET